MIRKVVFDKTCKCGNHMQIAVTKHENFTVEAESVNGADGKPSCYMIGSVMAECAKFPKRYKAYHEAYTVEARTWK